LLAAAFIALKVASHKENATVQTAPKAQPTKTSGTLPGRTRTARPPTFQVTNAAEKPVRQKLEEEGRYTGIFAKEAEWKEKFRRLKRGMTVQEAVAVMGEPPTRVEALTNSGVIKELVPVATIALQTVTGKAVVYYSPDGLAPIVDQRVGPRPDRLPFDFFAVEFDDQGRLISKLDRDENPRDRMRRESSESPEGREMLAKEAEWKERSKALREGMTIEQAISLMGEPTQRQKMPPEGEGITLLYYAPNGSKDLFWSSGNKLDILTNFTLTFDSAGKLEKIK
jgi:hypothetical protein